MLHYSLFIHEMSGLFFPSLGEEFMCVPLPVWNALFDLRAMPLECPSCDESKVRWIKVEADKTGMCFLVTSPLFLALRLCPYTLPFLPKGLGRWLTFILLGTVFHAQMGLACWIPEIRDLTSDIKEVAKNNKRLTFSVGWDWTQNSKWKPHLFYLIWYPIQRLPFLFNLLNFCLLCLPYSDYLSESVSLCCH